MSGLTKVAKDILDFHDSGMASDLIAVVLRVPVDLVRSTVRLYQDTAVSRDALEELLPDTTRPNSASTRARSSRSGSIRIPDGWDAIDPRTGTPVGVGKGWDYAPAQVTAAAKKIGAWDYQIGKAFMADLPDTTRDALSQAYRRLPSVADDTRRYARRVLGEGGKAVIEPIRTLGMTTTEDIKMVQSMKQMDVAAYDWSIAQSDIHHIENRHGATAERQSDQVAVSIDDYALLPTIIAAPDLRADEGLSGTWQPVIRLEKTIAGLRYIALFEVRGGKRRTLALKTFYIKVVK